MISYLRPLRNYLNLRSLSTLPNALCLYGLSMWHHRGGQQLPSTTSTKTSLRCISRPSLLTSRYTLILYIRCPQRVRCTEHQQELPNRFTEALLPFRRPQSEIATMPRSVDHPQTRLSIRLTSPNSNAFLLVSSNVYTMHPTHSFLLFGIMARLPDYHESVINSPASKVSIAFKWCAWFRYSSLY